MFPPQFKRVPVWAVVGLVLSISLPACGDDDDSGDGSSSSSAAGTASGKNLEAARKAIEPHYGQASQLPDLPPLEKRPTGKLVYLMSQGAPEVQPHIAAASEALQTLGMKTKVLNAGTSAASVASAFDTAVTDKPAAVMDFAIPPQLFLPQLKKLVNAGVVVTGSAAPGAKELGMLSSLNNPALEKAGKLLADYVYVKQGDDANVVFYNVPEIAFSPLISESFEKEMKTVCPDCEVRITDIPASTLGSTAAGKVVSDLQANPDTNWAVFGLVSVMLGLPQQLETAGMADLDIVTFAGGDIAYEMIKSDIVTADFGISIPENVWLWSDSLARELSGQKVPPASLDDLPPTQFLEKKDINFDIKKGFLPDADYKEHFKEIWGL